MSEDNKARVRRFYEEVFDKGNLDVIGEMAAPNFVDHNPAPDQGPGAEGVRKAFAEFRAAFTGMRATVEHMIAEGDMVAAHVSIRGRHTGELMGIPPSGQEVVMRVSDIVRIENGKAVERWGVEDVSGLLPQG